MRVNRISARRCLVAAAAVGAVTAAGMGALSAASGQAAPAAHAASGKLTVLGAASLSLVFPKIYPSCASTGSSSCAKYTFNGSGTLETDIEQGAPADVYAAANSKDPDALYAKGLVEKPVEFATNELVMVVPPDNPAHITSVNDITKKGVKIVVCNAAQPCGDYASTVFMNLGITTAADKNIVSTETDVTQVLAEVAAGQADVGFVYITDAKSVPGKVKVILLPARAMPGTQDWIAIVKGSKSQAAAKAFVNLVLSKRGQSTLAAAGFGKP